ncbi:MAG: chemotaxis protein CheW [Beggiatoa sp. IS2]|nr:MAG: chemotaxis protein CheW [Beggiatoa sp. IS2]
MLAGTDKTSEPFILFEIGKTTYGISSKLVQQMEIIEEITPIPNAPDYVEGVILSRGQVIPALSLRKRFGLEKIAHNSRTRLIVINTEQRVVGFIVDTAREFVSIQTSAIQPPPEKSFGLSGRYLQGIAKVGERLVLILNVTEMLNNPITEPLLEE